MPPPRLVSCHPVLLLTMIPDLAIMSVSAGTELLLEPSGGRALLVEKSETPPKAREEADQPEIIQVFPAETDEIGGDDAKVETKRAAILLDKIMYAVQKALDEN